MTKKVSSEKSFAFFLIGLSLSPFTEAHIELSEREATAGQAHVASLMVMHGCESEPTTSIRVRIPDGVVFVTPQYKPGWDIEVKKDQLDDPYDVAIGNGNESQMYTITEVVTEITWKNGELPSNAYDTFSIWMRLPNTPDETVYFKAIQTCSESVVRWIEVPRPDQSPEELELPAPSLRLIDEG